MLASVAAQAGLSLTWSETPEDTFSHDEAHLITFFLTDPALRTQNKTSTAATAWCQAGRSWGHSRGSVFFVEEIDQF